MTEIIPVPRNLNFAVLPAESIRASLFCVGKMLREPRKKSLPRQREALAGAAIDNGSTIWYNCFCRVFLPRVLHKSGRFNPIPPKGGDSFENYFPYR